MSTQPDLRLSAWATERLVCPYDRQALRYENGRLRCANGHAHRVVRGIPILFREDVPDTHWHATQAREAPEEGIPWGRTSGLNDYVQQAIAATGGYMYRPLIGRLTEYPIPTVRLPPGNGKSLLDLGSNWGRWTFAAAKAGYRAVGIDPSLPAVQAAYEVAAELGLEADFVVGDARFPPFRDGSFDTIFSYSVLQHFSKDDVRQTLSECSRVLASGGRLLIQMANALGVRSLFHQARRRFRTPVHFEVRYWTPRELLQAFSSRVGPSRLSVDGFFTLNAQAAEAHLLARRFRAIVALSDALRGLAGALPWLSTFADSVYIESLKS